MVYRSGTLLPGILLGLMAIASAALVAGLLAIFGVLGTHPDAGRPIDWVDALTLLVIAPVTETALMWLGFLIASRLAKAPTNWIALAVLMAGSHSLVMFNWGVVVLVPFLIYARVFAETTLSMKRRFNIVLVAHVTNNLVAGVLEVVVSGLGA